MQIAEMTSPQFGAAKLRVVLLPVGSVEPHGPHLPLGTDTLLSVEACQRAIPVLSEFCTPMVAPAIPYGVTEYARSFPGAVSVPAEVLSAYLGAVIDAFVGQGAQLVCVVNNHLEPAHDAALRQAVAGRAAVLACPLSRRWGRTLSAEFKHGSCHAGRYETSLVLAANESLVQPVARDLPAVPISLSAQIQQGVSEFVAMGLTAAYAGSPAEATVAEGAELYARLVDMVVGEVREALLQQGAL